MDLPKKKKRPVPKKKTPTPPPRKKAPGFVYKTPKDR